MKSIPSNANTIGIDNLKPVVDFLGTTVSAVLDADANGDGKVSLLEAARVAPSVIFRIFGIFNNLQKAGAEIKDLTADEISQLIATLGITLKLNKVDADLLLQEWLNWAAQTVILVDKTAKFRKWFF